MPDYSKGKIYTIRCKSDPSLIYVGSTIQSLAKRFGGHKIDGKREEHKSQFHNKVEDWNDWYIELYESFPCKSVEELRKKEGEVIREIATLNQYIAGRSKAEWEKENADKRKEYLKTYSEDNKDIIKEKKREYYEDNKERLTQSFVCVCGGKYTIAHKSKHNHTKKHQNYLLSQAGNNAEPLHTLPP